MGQLFNELKQDILYQHGMNACLNCGVLRFVRQPNLMITLREK